jgi:hypothetical protein
LPGSLLAGGASGNSCALDAPFELEAADGDSPSLAACAWAPSRRRTLLDSSPAEHEQHAAHTSIQNALFMTRHLPKLRVWVGSALQHASPHQESPLPRPHFGAGSGFHAQQHRFDHETCTPRRRTRAGGGNARAHADPRA